MVTFELFLNKLKEDGWIVKINGQELLKLLIRCFFQDLVLFIGPGFSNRIETTRLDHQAYYRFLLKLTFLIIVFYSSLWPKIQDKPKKPFKKHHQVLKTSFEVQTNRHYLQLENFVRSDGVGNFC